MCADNWVCFRQAMTNGQYFEAHEILEIPWRETRSIRMHIAIWIAAAFVHWSRNEHRGARILFERVLNHPAASSLPLLEDIQQWSQAVAREKTLSTPSLQQLESLVGWGQSENGHTY